MALLAQFLASLLAIVLLAWVARRMGLGGDVRIRDEAHARELAEEVIGSFQATRVSLDRGRIGAILCDKEGRVMVLRRHGAHFAGRLLDGHVHSRLDRTQLSLATQDKHFGSVTLDLGDAAQTWAASLRRVKN
jgi:hypothetical protein